MEQFLLDGIFGMTLAATVQRSPTYQESADEKDKETFRRDLQNSLQSLSEQYRKAVSEAAHCKNIDSLSNDLSAKHRNTLFENRFRIGSAQKALNLYLKYLWCLNRIETPPHCPIDSIVLEEIRNKTGHKNAGWTKLNSIDQYKEVIREVKSFAGELNLAEWELHLYNNSRRPMKKLVSKN